MTEVTIAGKARSVLGFLKVIYHTVEAHEGLVTECDMLHKNIGTHTLFCYFRKNGDITGVLLDYDHYIVPFIDKTSIAATAPDSLSSKSKGKQKATVPVDTLAAALEKMKQ